MLTRLSWLARSVLHQYWLIVVLALALTIPLPASLTNPVCSSKLGRVTVSSLRAPIQSRLADNGVTASSIADTARGALGAPASEQAQLHERLQTGFNREAIRLSTVTGDIADGVHTSSIANSVHNRVR